VTPERYMSETGVTERDEAYLNCQNGLAKPNVPETVLGVLVKFAEVASTLDKLKAELFYGSSKNIDPKELHWQAVSENAISEFRRDFTLARHLHMILGIAGEAGEIAEHLIDSIKGHGRELDHHELEKEVGDLLWYVARELDNIDSSFEKVFDINIAKLRARYPEGFTSHDARNRNIEAEDQAAKIEAMKEQIDKTMAESGRTRPGTTTTDGKPLSQTGSEGQHSNYLVLNEEERAKGFVRPYRDQYRHVGIRPKYPLRDLTEEEKERYHKIGYVKFEVYPEGESPATGRFWKESDLSSGCGVVTHMGRALSETYARDPKFYGSTFCIGCNKHLPVEEFEWMDGEKLGS
jgi:NTP pyrophosphatase (non-canonical NTP hydrolase)